MTSSIDKPHYMSLYNEDSNDDPLIFLYFRAQTIQVYWRCRVNKRLFQLLKHYFPIMHAREKAATKIEHWRWQLVQQLKDNNNFLFFKDKLLQCNHCCTFLFSCSLTP